MLKKIMFAGLGMIVSLGVFAESAATEVFSDDIPFDWQSIVLINAGPAWIVPMSSTIVLPYVQPPTSTIYSPQIKNKPVAAAELFFGLQRQINPIWTGQFGLAVSGVSNMQISGVTTVDGVPNVYSYSYYVNHLRVSVKGKLIANYLRIVQPYLSAGLGYGYNNTTSYFASSVDPVNFPAPLFTPQNHAALSYTAGAGLQKMITPHIQVGVGYEFAFLGQSILGGDGATVTDVRSNNIYIHELLISLGYVF